MAAGLWVWRAQHPDWRPHCDWEPLVALTCVESDGETLLLDPLAPPAEASYDGRGRNETPLWLPEHRALVFADALTAPGGILRVWATPWHEERALPALRALLELPFEHVIVSHGDPVHTRANYERALEVEPWSG